MPFLGGEFWRGPPASADPPPPARWGDGGLEISPQQGLWTGLQRAIHPDLVG